MTAFHGKLNTMHHDSTWTDDDELKIKVKPKYRNHRGYKFCVMTGNYLIIDVSMECANALD